MFPPMLSESLRVRSGVKKYLGPREHVIYATRRHPVVLSSAVAVWLIGLVLGLAAGLSYSAGGGNAQLSWAGAAVVLAGAAFFGWRAWQWRMARYVLTSERVLLIEGILSRRVNGLPLRSVLDTTYHRTLAGRIFGYGNLELNLSGQPGLRMLTSLPRPDTIYYWILTLIRIRETAAKETTQVPKTSLGTGGPSGQLGQLILDESSVARWTS